MTKISHIERFKQKTFSALTNLRGLSNTSVGTQGANSDIWIFNGYAFVPDVQFHWSDDQEHWVVYLHIGSAGSEGKLCAGRPICSLPNLLSVFAFIQVYQFIHKYRAGRKV